MCSMKHSLFIASLCLLVPCYNSLKGDSVGCYTPASNLVGTNAGGSVDSCLLACEAIYYRYAVLSYGTTCYCSNVPGLVVADPTLCNRTCLHNSTQLCGGDKVTSVYDTGFLVPGPPTNVLVENITETSLNVEWHEPKAHGIITGYKVKCEVIHTYDPEYENKQLVWLFPNTTFSTQVEGLHPGTEYNMSVFAYIEGIGNGVERAQRVETDIGVPEPAPTDAIIVEKFKDHMTISIPPSSNINGPISKYRVVVFNQQFQQGFLPMYLKDYHGAVREDLPYYITAQLEPSDIKTYFTIGNKHIYDGFYNAPLSPDTNIQIAIGVVSIKNGETKYRYTHSTDITILNIKQKEQESSSMMLVLGIAVAVGVILLLVGLGVIIVLRQRVGAIRRQRLSQSMPLSGPCIEIENTGFIPDEELRVDHYGNLKRQLWNIPRNFLEVDTNSMVGMGNFGRYIRARVQHQGSYKPALVQVISDGELSKSDKKTMLGELDLLIKANGHENVVTLLGICEIPETLYVVLEDNRHTLKELLLSSRHTDIQHDKFSLISEKDIIKIALGVCKGMEYLSNKRLMHKRLCCRNIVMTDGNTPKVSGFGLSHIYQVNSRPDYTRWTALEMFKQNTYQVKSDVWSYGCVLWEIFSLGGTLYPNLMTKDVPNRVMKGSRPPQLHYLGDDLYQVCLHCWQLDLDERPSFSNLVESLESILNQESVGSLSFSYYNGFEYEVQNDNLESFNLM